MSDPFKDLGFQEDVISDDPLKNLGFQEDASTPSMTESALRGAANSATMGLADEATGAGEAAGKALFGPDQIKDLLENYKKYRDESRANYKSAEEANPGSYFAGQLAGGLVPGVGIGGEIAAGVGAAGKIANAVKTGALAGGAYGFGQSEKEDLPGIAGDTLRGTAEGGLTGGVLSGAYQGVAKGANNLAARSKVIQDLLESVKKGTQGEELVGTIAKKNVQKSTVDASKEIIDALQEEIDRGKSLKKAAEATVQKTGTKIDISGILKDYEQQAEKFQAERKTPEETSKNKFLDFIRNRLYGEEEPKEVSIPGMESEAFIPGKTLPSGEEKAIERLKQQQAEMNINKQLGQPEAISDNRLKEKFAGQELTSEEPRPLSFKNPETMKSSTGLEGRVVTGPEGNKLAQVIKTASPGEIQVTSDPSTGKKFAYFKDSSGIAHTEPISDNVARSIIKKNPEAFQTIQQRSGQGDTELDAEGLTRFLQTTKNQTYLGDNPYNIPQISQMGTNLHKDLQTLQRSLGESGVQSEQGDKIIHSAATAMEMLTDATKGATFQDKVAMNNVLSKNIRDFSANGEQGYKTTEWLIPALDKLKETNPELSNRINDKILDRAKVNDLIRQIGSEGFAPGVAGFIKGTAKTGLYGTGNLAGLAYNKVSSAPGKLASTISSFIKGSTPESLNETLQVLKTNGTLTPDLEHKLTSAATSNNNALRNAMLFSIMQQPSYRKLLGVSDE